MRDVLAVVAERRGARPGSEDLERGVQFVIAYIEQVPYMMKVAWTAACNVGLEPEMRRFLWSDQMLRVYPTVTEDGPVETSILDGITV